MPCIKQSGVNVPLAHGDRYRRFHVLPRDDLQADWLLSWSAPRDGSLSRFGGFLGGLLRCLHFDMNSDLLFNASLFRMIVNFSSKHRLHMPLLLTFKLDLFSMSQVSVCQCVCPLRGSCLERSVVYKATIQHDDQKKTYYGLAGGRLKTGIEIM